MTRNAKLPIWGKLALAGLVLCSTTLFAQLGDQTDTGLPGNPWSPPDGGGGGLCADIVIGGTLGSGSPDWPSTSGTQTGRLNRNGISSACGAPKSCLIFDSAPGRAFDAYTFTNDFGATACVSVTLDVITQTACNLQVDAYDTTFDPANICTNYLADPGLSSGIPPSQTGMSFDVAAGQSFVLDVHTTNPGEIDCLYTLTVSGEICQQYQPPLIQEIPTASALGLAALALLLAGAAFLVLRRHA